MRKRNVGGFTIIEIMVIVAIMAILAGVSIPQYQRMVNKGNQQGAVSGLTSIYMAEKNFAAENHTYTACIGAIGVSTPAGKRWYTMGFNAAGLNGSCGESGNMSCAVSAWDEGSIVTQCATNTSGSDWIPADRVNMAGGAAIPLGVNLGTLPTDMTNHSFIARATGQIASGASQYDKWYIDESGTPVNNAQVF